METWSGEVLNIISLSCHEQVHLIMLCFERVLQFSSVPDVIPISKLNEGKVAALEAIYNSGKKYIFVKEEIWSK